MVAIEARQLRVRKGAQTICTVPELTVASGECLEVLGANGSGKSTLLKVLAGLEQETDGCLTLTDGCRTLVHQQPYFFRCSVLDNTAYGLRARRPSSASAQRGGEAALRE